ncbi:MAG: hypothetical protein M3065_09630 [Actinomycetota bacterium]|nr:hypothetical protein [Actinomycetota bacterium]
MASSGVSWSDVRISERSGVTVGAGLSNHGDARLGAVEAAATAAAGRELEAGTAVAVWAATLGDGGTAIPFHASVDPDGDEVAIDDLPELKGASGMIAREVTITAADGHVIYELAGQPALVTVQRIISELSPRERSLIDRGLLIGIVVGGGKPEYEQGDFGVPDHDAVALERELQGAPTAGFFAAGEIGPVGGRSFLHSFTATVAVFAG